MSTREITEQRPVHVAGFHEGERAMQQQAGVSADAARLEGMLAPALLTGGAAKFLADQSFAVLVARDEAGTLWTSPLLDRPGFLAAHAASLSVRAVPPPGDPLDGLAADQSVALIAVDLQRRRRFRVNGWMSSVTSRGLRIDVEEAYGNCPSYIQQRPVAAEPLEPHTHAESALAEGGTLSREAAEIVRSADTFFLGTQHPERGADASHKGGNPGFVRVEGTDIIWPDYAGNNMFNSMGNLAVDPTASLLFVDFTTGKTLQLSGSARVELRAATDESDDTSTGRWVRFTPSQGVLRSSGIRGGSPVMSPHNPTVRGSS